MLKKAVLAVSLVVMAGSALAANNPDLCPSLAGAWSGTYNANGQQQPIGIYMTYQNNHIYGYTLANNDSNGYNFGSWRGKYVFSANCTNSQISNLQFINLVNAQAKCGAVNSNTQPVHVDFQQNLTLQIPFNNQTVTATFPNSPRVVAREWLIQQAINLSQNPPANLSACQ